MKYNGPGEDYDQGIVLARSAVEGQRSRQRSKPRIVPLHEESIRTALFAEELVYAFDVYWLASAMRAGAQRGVGLSPSLGGRRRRGRHPSRVLTARAL